MRSCFKILIPILVPIVLLSCFIFCVSAKPIGREMTTQNTGTCGESVKWGFASYSGTLTISGSGEMYDYRSGGQPWSEYIGQIKRVVISNGVTYVGAGAFRSHTAMESMEISASLQALGYQALQHCTALSSFRINGSNKYFSTDSYQVLLNKDHTYLHFAPATLSGTYSLPSTVTGMSDYAFSDCLSLTRITLSSALSRVTIDAFPRSSKLTSIGVPTTNGYFSEDKGILYNKAKTQLLFCPGGYMGSYDLLSTTEVVKEYAFSQCEGLSSVSLPSALTTIENYAFSQCSSLKSISFSTGLTSIGESSFSRCIALESLSLPEGLQSLGSSVFYGCIALSEVTLPESLTTIPAYSFNNCTMITELTLGSKVTSLGWRAFYNMPGLTRIHLGNSLKTMGDEAFYGCTALETITLPDTLTSMGTYCFYQCKNLVSVDMGDGLTAIPNYAFAECFKLKDITWSKNLKSIGTKAFSSTSLTELILPNGFQYLFSKAFSSTDLDYIVLPESLISIGSDCFIYCNTLSHCLYSGTAEQWSAVKCNDTHKVFGSLGFHTGAKATDIQILSGCQYDHLYCDICADHFAYTSNGRKEHSYHEDSLCTLCGAPSYLEYRVNTYDETVSITDYTGGAERLTVPDTIEGLPVVEIRDLMFSGATEIRWAELGEHIQTIGREVFYGCTSLESISFGNSLLTMGDSVLKNCRSLKNVQLPYSLTTMGIGCFSGCTSLRHAVLSKNLDKIQNYTFYNCTSLESVVLGDKFTKIGDYAFYQCNRLCHVAYAGNREQWLSLTVNSNNEPLSSRGVTHYDCSGDTVRFVPTCCGSYLDCALCPAPVRYQTEVGGAHRFVDGICAVCGVPSYLKYSISENCTVTITGYDGSVTHVEISDTIESLPVKDISRDAFISDSNLRSVSFGNSLDTVGVSAFENCKNLSQIQWGNNVKTLGVAAFAGCESLVEVTAPASLTRISGSAFRDCTGLERVVLSEKTYLIDTYSFQNCTNLREIQVGSSLQYIWDAAFKNCNSLAEIHLPDTFLTLGPEAFYNCDSLEKVHLGAGFRGMNKKAFYDCDGLKSISIPASCSIICEEAFSHCDSLEVAVIAAEELKARAFAECISLSDLSLAEGVKTIRYEAFDNCQNLKNISMPTSLEWVEVSVFRNCTAIQRVDITDIVSWCSVNFSNLYSNPMYYGALYINGELPVNVVLPESIEQLDDYCFLHCNSLESIALPSSATRLGVSTFSGCKSLKSIYIPVSITEIGNHAFSDCTSLSTVDINGQITSLPEGVFTYCSSLKLVTLPDTLTDIRSYAFYFCKELRSVTLPYSLTRIREFAFDDCTMLSHILFRGSQKQWNAIQIDRENGMLDVAVKHYNCKGHEVYWTSFLHEPYLYCSICDTALTEKPRCFHDDMRLVNDYPATCTSPGYTGDVICLICNETVERGQVIPPLAHSTYVVNSKEPTCTEYGFTGNTLCRVCGQIIEEGSEIPPLYHPEAFIRDAVQPNCTEAGYTGDTLCLLCNEILVPGSVLPPLDHPNTEIREPVEPGCNYPGYSGDTFCLTCGELISRGQEIPASGHSYANGTCGICGEADPNYAPIPTENPFLDVPKGAYYHTPVLWAVGHKITTGMSSDTFAPESPCTRAQIVTFLWRAFGSPEPKEQNNPFRDVSASTYYYKAVMWAVEMGITTGTSADKFSPEDVCTRGQVATFLWRAKGKPATQVQNNPFSDVSKKEYFYQPILWAVDAGVTNGTGHGKFSPQDTCTRGQIVTFLYRAFREA